MVQLLQAAKILEVKNRVRNQRREDSKIEFNVNGKNFEIYLNSTIQQENYSYPCYKCIYSSVLSNVAGGRIYGSNLCNERKPKISFTHTILHAPTNEYFINNCILVDGDSIYISYREFDILFYTNFVNLFISSESELIDFLKEFDTSFKVNSWYNNSDGIYLHRLIRESKWNSINLKAEFDCLHHENGLSILELDEFNQYGYEPLIRAFKIKYANTSSSIVTDSDVSIKLEKWIPRIEFKAHINKIYELTIQNYKTRKKTYYDSEINEWRQYDGSFDAKRKIFLSQFGQNPEYEFKRRIIQNIIRQAENEVRIEKGYNIVGTLVNESILFSKLKTYFPSYTVISQYRPKWLGRQSLDIYIEELKIAIEYQGDQHSRPVDFYGGIQAFELTKLRDEKKKDRCRRNGCKLIYVYPGYNFENVVQQIIELSDK